MELKGIRYWNYGEYSSSNYGAHTLAFEDKNNTYYFSYDTLVAVRTSKGLFVRENIWGTTTGKHLNWIDGGSKRAKKERLTKEQFEKVLSEL